MFAEPGVSSSSKARTRTRDLRLSVKIRAKPLQIYQALTSARELCRWWLQGAETDARSSGRLRMIWPKHPGRQSAFREREGCFVDLQPERKVAWMWKTAAKNVPPLCSFFMLPQGRSCEVTLLHAGFSSRPAADKAYAHFAAGWEDALAKLKLYLETARTMAALYGPPVRRSPPSAEVRKVGGQAAEAIRRFRHGLDFDRTGF